MRAAMESQPEELRRLLGDPGPAEAAAARLAGRRLLVGIGTSWHAAHHGAWMLREAGVEAGARTPPTSRRTSARIDAADGVIVLSHTGRTGYSMQVLERARRPAPPSCTSPASATAATSRPSRPEASYAYTASHTGALLRLAQIAEALGARLGELDGDPRRGGARARPARAADRPPRGWSS